MKEVDVYTRQLQEGTLSRRSFMNLVAGLGLGAAASGSISRSTTRKPSRRKRSICAGLGSSMRNIAVLASPGAVTPRNVVRRHRRLSFPHERE